MTRWTWMALVATLSVSLAPPGATAQTSDAVGVVTTVDGGATVARPALPSPLALKFKDDVFGRDRIRTQENSLVRVLLGGKAILTVRELSQVTIHEEPNRAVVTMPDGKVVLAVAKQRMRPGESIEIRTPNAVAAVRGSLMSVAFSAAAGVTQAICASGDCLYGFAGQALAALPPGQGTRNAQVAPATAAEMNAAFNFRAGNPTFTAPEEGFQTALLESQANQATQVAQFVSTGTVNPLPTTTTVVQNPTTAPINPTTSNPLIPGQIPGSSPPGSGGDGSTPPPTGNGTLLNGGFETGSFSSWTAAGAHGVVGALGPTGPRQGDFMALLHTGVGATNNASSTLTQSFAVTGGKLYTILASVSFYSNEHPNQSPGFNDFWQIGVRNPGQSVTTTLKRENRSDVFTFLDTSVNTATAPASAAGYTANGPFPYGVTGFRDFSLQWTPTASGVADLSFLVSDVLDTNVDSAILIDSVAVLEDPPLFFVNAGEALRRAGPEPLLRLTGTPATFDSLLAIGAGGRATLDGPLLRATDSDLTVLFSLLSAFQGGRLETSTREPLAFLSGGTHSIGTIGVPMFDLSGSATAVDPETGLTLGTDRPLTHAGALFEAANATVSAHRAVRVDTALLEASAPLVALAGQSTLTTAADAVQLSYQAKVTSLGPLVRLDRSTLVVAAGAALNVGGGSALQVTGDVFSLTNGSALRVLNGTLLSLSSGSVMNVNGALVAFGGTGGNLVSVSNGLCPCTTIGGIPVSLTGGALARNVSITGAIKNAGLGSVAANGALIRVDGAGTKLTISGL